MPSLSFMFICDIDKISFSFLFFGKLSQNIGFLIIILFLSTKWLLILFIFESSIIFLFFYGVFAFINFNRLIIFNILSIISKFSL